MRWKSGVKSTQIAAISCTFWPECQSILFSRSWPHSQGNTKINTLPLKSWTSKKVSCWAAGWKSNIGRWNSLSILQTTVTPVFFFTPSHCTREFCAPAHCIFECNPNSSGPISYHFQRKYQQEGQPWKTKRNSRKRLWFPDGKTCPPTTLEAGKRRLHGFYLVKFKTGLLTFWDVGAPWKKVCLLDILLPARDKWGIGLSAK